MLLKKVCFIYLTQRWYIPVKTSSV